MDYDLPEVLTVDVDGPVRIVTINRPDKLNAVNEELHRALASVWGQLAADRDARAVILTGAGRAFSAGGDYDLLQQQHESPEMQVRLCREADQMVRDMAAFHLPVVAAVNGPAVGLGCNIAVMCDIILMSDRAHFADPHVSIGLVAGDGAAATWPLLTSLVRVKEYLFTGERIPAERAVEFGLANRVVPADALMSEALRLAQQLASQPAQALQDTKRALNAHLAPAIAGPFLISLMTERQSIASDEHGEILRRLRTGKA